MGDEGGVLGVVGAGGGVGLAELRLSVFGGVDIVAVAVVVVPVFVIVG